MENDRIAYIINFAKAVEDLRQKELQKMPYRFNILDRLNENCNTKILLELLRFKENNVHPFLQTFIYRMNVLCRQYSLNTNAADVDIEFNHEFIDGLIEDKHHQYAIIIENKIHWAVDQERQIERYIQSVNNHNVKDENIYVVYLTSDGNKKVSDISLTNIAKEKLDVTESDLGRFVEMNFKDDIIPWLKDDVLPNIRAKDVLMTSSVHLYIDYLERLMHISNDEKPIRNIMEKKIKDILQITNADVCKQWTTINDNLNNVMSLREELANMKSAIEKGVVDTWHSVLGPFTGYNDQFHKGFYQLYIKDMPTNIHFEWMMNRDKLFNSRTYRFELHVEGNAAIYHSRLTRNDCLVSKAMDKGFEIKDNAPVVFRKYLSTPDGMSFARTSNQVDFLNGVYNDCIDLIPYIKTYKLLDAECKITQALKTKMGDDWITWPNNDAWDLVKRYNKNGNCIGIESSYSINNEQQVEYRIYITVWNKEHWTKDYDNALAEHMKPYLTETYDKCKDVTPNGRIYLHLKPLVFDKCSEDNIDKICNRLNEISNIMNIVTQ